MLDFTKLYTLGTHQVPALWPFMAPEELRFFSFPEERRATCGNCPKVQEEGFHPDIRCCTYHPRIPNFQLGTGLKDPQSAPIIKSVIAQGMATPEGLVASPYQFQSALAMQNENKFGKSEVVVCPFLDRQKRMCQIYAHRNSVCSSFFCINDNGREGTNFWESLQSYMGQMETALGQWAMSQAGMNPSDYFAAFDSFADAPMAAAGPNGSWSDEALQRLWGSFRGNEEAFFIDCADSILAEKDNLVSIADQITPQMPTTFDRGFRRYLKPQLQKEFDASGGAGGTPMKPSDLWYQLELAHRNLWALPDAQTKIMWHPDTTVTASGRPDFPYRLVKDQASLLLSVQEHEFLEAFRSKSQPLSHEWLFSPESFDARKLVAQGLALSLLTTC